MVVYLQFFFQNMIMDNTPFFRIAELLVFFCRIQISLKWSVFTILFYCGKCLLPSCNRFVFWLPKLNADINSICSGNSGGRSLFFPGYLRQLLLRWAGSWYFLPQGILNSVLSFHCGRADSCGLPGKTADCHAYPDCRERLEGVSLLYDQFFLAGLQSIPGALYEAASIDGAKQNSAVFQDLPCLS